MKTIQKKISKTGIKTTLDLIRDIVRRNKEIQILEVRAYLYVPHKITQTKEEKLLFMSRSDFLKGKVLENFIDSLEDGWNVGVNSRVKLRGGRVGHIPMLDLAPRKSAASLKKVKERIEKIIKPKFGGGYILETGNSYHYLGKKIYEDKMFEEFLGRSLITSIVTLTPANVPNIHEHIADYRYVGYSLIRHFTCLRITARGDKPFMPRIIAEV